MNVLKVKDLILTPSDRGLLMWQLEPHKKFYGTTDHHMVSEEVFNGVKIPFFHPFRSRAAFIEAFTSRIKTKSGRLPSFGRIRAVPR